MKVVLIGKNGQLGREFQHTLPHLGNLISLGREDLDVSNHHEVQKTLIELHPNLIINVSAYTEVDLAEAHIAMATSVNSIAPGIMADVARKINAVFIHYSTDYVFDGRKSIPYAEDDITSPLNVYGGSKLKGEEIIKQAGNAYLIFRTSWVYSMWGNSFVNKVLNWARNSKTLRIVSDQVSSPTWARSLAEITTQLLTKNNADLLDSIGEKCGVYHLTASGYTSRYEWAKSILAHDSNSTEQLIQTIEPVSSREFPTLAERPLFSALDCAKFINIFELHPPHWEEALKLAMKSTN